VKYKIFLPLLVSTLLLAAYTYAQNQPQPSPENQEKPQVIKIKPESGKPKAESGKPAITQVLFKTESEKLSYTFGSQFAQGMKAQGVEINLDLFIRGFQDALASKPLALTPQQQSEIINNFQARNRQRQLAQQKAQSQVLQKGSGKNIQESKAFLEQNAKKPGIKTTPSGLQYRIIKEGTGKIPTANNSVKTHYRGTLINGTEFDSSYKRNQPATFQVRGVIKGWTEALQLMKVGAKWELFIPSELAYGSRGRPSIPPNSALIFEIELLEILP